MRMPATVATQLKRLLPPHPLPPRPQVCDFNLSAFGRGPAGSAVPGNPRWLAPEVLQGERATAASDTYAFALLLWELLTWQLPWSGMDVFQVRGAGGRICMCCWLRRRWLLCASSGSHPQLCRACSAVQCAPT